MTKIIYEASARFSSFDFDTKEEAKGWVEEHCGGRVVTFVVWPDGQHKSCAMETFDGTEWTGHDITL